MSEENSKLLENLMSMLGDNPTETLSQMLSALSTQSEEAPSEVQTEKAEESQTGGLGIDPSMLMALGSLMQQTTSGEKDDRSQLLVALRPFLSEERRPQLDRAIKLLQLSKLAKTAQELNLFKELL